jgi:hypothetical protein
LRPPHLKAGQPRGQSPAGRLGCRVTDRCPGDCPLAKVIRGLRCHVRCTIRLLTSAATRSWLGGLSDERAGYTLNHQLAGGVDGGEVWVRGFQEGAAVLQQEGSDRAHPVNRGSDDLARAWVGAWLEDEDVAIADMPADHGIAHYTQGEGVACGAIGGGVEVDGTRVPNLLRRILFSCRRYSFSKARSWLKSWCTFATSGLAEFRELLFIDGSITGLADRANSKRQPGFVLRSG